MSATMPCTERPNATMPGSMPMPEKCSTPAETFTLKPKYSGSAAPMNSQNAGVLNACLSVLLSLALYTLETDCFFSATPSSAATSREPSGTSPLSSGLLRTNSTTMTRPTTAAPETA